MPLVECPDCKKQISDAALICVHCGRPMKPVARDCFNGIHPLEELAQSEGWPSSSNKRSPYEVAEQRRRLIKGTILFAGIIAMGGIALLVQGGDKIGSGMFLLFISATIYVVARSARWWYHS